MARFDSATHACLVQPDTVPLALIPDGSGVSAIFQGFEIRMQSGPSGFVADTVAELDLTLQRPADAADDLLSADARFGGLTPPDGRFSW